jgi:uncharacterized protein (TIGR00661 family)
LEEIFILFLFFWSVDVKTIAYYISDYGYGHATRSIAIIRKLLEIEQAVRIIICHSFAMEFIKQSLPSNRISFRSLHTDVGYILKDGSIKPDKDRLLNEYLEFTQVWVDKVEKEKLFILDNKVDLVISDISPLAFEAAESLGIPSVGVSNFTWYTAYQGLLDEKSLSTLKQAYEKMTYFFSLAGSNESWGKVEQSFNFFSREKEENEVERIRNLVNPDGKKTVIFVGLGMKIENELIDQFSFWETPQCVFITSSNMKICKENVFSIPEDYLESQNYIAASDLVISKAGWGMVSEAVNSTVPLLLIVRKNMREDLNTTQYLEKRGLCDTIEWDELRDFHLDRESILQIKNKKEVALDKRNSSDAVAKEILKLLY